MFGVIPVAYLNIVPTLVIVVLILALAVYLFKLIWMSNFEFRFSRGRQD